MSVPVIGFEEMDARLDWRDLGEAIVAGHALARADVGDTFLHREGDTLLSRAAFIDGLGVLVKAATVYPGNPAQGKPMINGLVSLFSDNDGALEALLDFHLVTKWKTAGDSLLAARLLARPDSREILIVGAGTVGRTLYAAYRSLFPEARFRVWNRSRGGAERFAADLPEVEVATDLEAAVRGADVITSATMSHEPLIKGAWLRPGQHLDLIGAYKDDMRETDDEALRRARIFVDSRDTTIDHIGELKTPIADGVISAGDVLADYYDIGTGAFARQSDSDITLFKNGGGAHLDLMTSRYILDKWRAAND